MRFVGVRYGENCRFIKLDLNTFGSEPYLIAIGNHVTIASGVKFVTHDGGVWVVRDKHPKLDVIAKVTIGNNVFIGMNSIIMPGVVIGDNCIIGAGSVVTKNVPDNKVFAGVPAKKIRDLNEYEEKVLRIGVNTKGLSYSEKKKFMLHHLT